MTVAALTPGRAAERGGSWGDGLAGVRELARLALRRDRIMLPAWVYVITAAVGEVAFSLKRLYPTAASRRSLTASVGHDPALAFLYGRLYGDSPGALTAWRYLAYGALGAALMSVFLVIRHTRADEQAGRLELAGSAAVGRHAALTAGLAVAGAANLALMVLVAVVLTVLRLPAGGAVEFGLAIGGCGLVFAAVAAVAAQISGTARGARGIAIAVLAAAFLLRGIGDSAGAAGPSWLTGLSPIGWAELARPFAGQRWWLLAAPAAATVLIGSLAFGLAAHRDQGAGLIAPRPGPPAAGALLRGPVGLAWRLQRGSLAGWAAGLLAMGVAVGAVAKGIGSLLGSSAQIREVFERLGGQVALTNAYLAGVMSLAGLVTAGYAVSAVLRLRSQETAQLADPVLAGPAGRVRWAASHLMVTAAGTAVVLAAAGLGAGLGYGLRAGDVGTQLPSLLGAALVQLPAVLVVAAVAMALIGALPRLAAAGGWTALTLAALITLLGSALRLGQPLLDISPFGHLPRLPGAPVTATPLLWLSAVVLALTAVGLAALRRRDIG